MKLVVGRSTRGLLGLAVLLVLSLGPLAGCALSSSTMQSAEATPLPAAKPAITSSPTAPTTTSHQQATQNSHCSWSAADQHYWKHDYASPTGHTSGDYKHACPRANWTFEALYYHEFSGVSSPSGSGSGSQPTGDPYNCLSGNAFDPSFKCYYGKTKPPVTAAQCWYLEYNARQDGLTVEQELRSQGMLVSLSRCGR